MISLQCAEHKAQSKEWEMSNKYLKTYSLDIQSLRAAQAYKLNHSGCFLFTILYLLTPCSPFPPALLALKNYTAFLSHNHCTQVLLPQELPACCNWWWQQPKTVEHSHLNATQTICACKHQRWTCSVRRYWWESKHSSFLQIHSMALFVRLSLQSHLFSAASP